MARTRANILCEIWEDEDFVALPLDAQRMYLFLLSQRDLNHAGLLPLRIRRWAAKSPGGTVGQVSKALQTLAKTEFILFDRETEEVLIRTLVRNDGVYKQPKVMLRMREEAKLMESEALRAAFAKELRRIPLEELSDAPGGPRGDMPSTREIVSGVIDSLLAELEPDTLPDTLPDTHSEGYAIPPRVRAGALHLPPATFHQPPGDAQVGGGGYLSSAQEPPPPPTPDILDAMSEPWRCPNHQGTDSPCNQCKRYKAAWKALEADRAKEAKAAEREAARAALGGRREALRL